MSMHSLRNTLLLSAIGITACDCSEIPGDADVAMTDVPVVLDAQPEDAGLDVAMTDVLVLDADGPAACSLEPEPECATVSNASVSLTLSDAEGSDLEGSVDFDFGYLFHGGGFTLSTNFLFMDNGDGDRCSRLQLYGQLIPPDGTRIVPPGTYEVQWSFRVVPNVVFHRFTTMVTLTAATEEVFAGSIVHEGAVDEFVLGVEGSFEVDNCRPWAMSL